MNGSFVKQFTLKQQKKRAKKNIKKLKSQKRYFDLLPSVLSTTIFSYLSMQNRLKCLCLSFEFLNLANRKASQYHLNINQTVFDGLFKHKKLADGFIDCRRFMSVQSITFHPNLSKFTSFEEMCTFCSFISRLKRKIKHISLPKDKFTLWNRTIFDPFESVTSLKWAIDPFVHQS